MNSKQILDPHATREAEKYTNPIPSREYILSLFKKTTRGMTRQKIASLLTLRDPEQEEALRRRLQAMRRDGQLLWSRSKGYTVAKESVFLKGKIIGNKEGFGFIAPEDGSPDLFLSSYQMRQVFPDDRVLVRVIGEGRRGRREAAIVEVLDRHTERLIGYYFEEHNALTVKPAHPRIHHTINIPPGSQADAQPGQIVLLEIIQQPDLHHLPTGRVLKILGDKNVMGIESMMAIQTYQLPYEWSKAVTREITLLKKQAPIDHTTPRVDLRDLPFVTIDGEDSKDFDDAVYCQLEKNQWRLWVAIADVSHYVKPATHIDEEASLRGNSVYLPHQVVPMLPEILSNDWCSLKPQVDRFCLVCEMKISLQGKLKTYEFYPATICSKARFTYHQVTEYLRTNEYPAVYQTLANSLKHLQGLYEVLFQARQKRGAIELNLPEAQILLNAQGKIDNILPKERTIAHRIIEECMLIANVSAARFLLESKIPGLFRVHDSPSPEKLADFKSFIDQLGLPLGSWLRRTLKPIDFAKLLEKAETHVDNQLIQTMLLRTMSQAIYSPKNKGHFGLAYPEYTHFTSPIRRYPDLIVHRMIYYLLTPQKEKNPFYYDLKTLENIGAHCSITERRADEATRQVISALKCQLMQSHLGEYFTGRITHITGFGFFVELQAKLIEGLVHISYMKDDHYLFDAKKMTLEGQRQGKIYRLGDTVRIQVARVNLESNEIDFELCDRSEESSLEGL